VAPSEFRDGIPVYERALGYNLSLIVEGKPGPSRQAVGISADPFHPSGRPDIQPIVSAPLGANPTTAVCDVPPQPSIGGVPASPSFDNTAGISNAISDLACRFVDGHGNSIARTASGEACTSFNGDFHFVGDGTTVQFCALVEQYWAFRTGETMFTVELRDQAGNLSAPASIIISVRH